jgi:protein MAK11
MAKRKREAASEGEVPQSKPPVKKAKAPPRPTQSQYVAKLGDGSPVTIQIIAGSYDRVLHGITATVKPSSGNSTAAVKKKPKDGNPPPTEKTSEQQAEFADTFLFNAHNSAIRCLAVSPPSAPAPGQTQKVLLATGSTDERINIYNLSAHPPPTTSRSTGQHNKLLSSLAPRPILENPKNRELGTLLHHTGNISRLAFPTRSKLLSAAEDSTIAVTRSRDWTLLHTFKCPRPKPPAGGRPSGDTADAGGLPTGVNDFAVHPSNKIMISVSKGERCMRLWNLETGKKSRVLNFEKGVLNEIGEGGRGMRWATGEARRIVWGVVKGEEEFAVGFDRDVVVYGMDCRVRCRVMGDAATLRTKVHEVCYVDVRTQIKDGKEGDAEEEEEEEEEEDCVLAVSTEDGRVLFFATDKGSLQGPPEGKTLPTAKLVAQLGGKEAGVSGRIKDFRVLTVQGEDGKRAFFVVTAGSDGQIRLWLLAASDLVVAKGSNNSATPQQVGKLLGTYGTQNRITCVEAFIMIRRPDGAEESEFEFDSEDDDEEEEDSDEE